MKDTWSSQLAYILTVAGATIGFGATWRFPYLVGQNGGGAYVLVFCIAMVLIGFPMILVENVIGRRMKSNVIDCFSGSIKGKKISKLWKIVGLLGVIGAFGIMSYYMVIGGWVLNYIYNVLLGNLDLGSNISASYTHEFYKTSIELSPLSVALATFIFVIINYVILVRGVIAGIEKAAKLLMPILFLLMLGMVLRNVTLPGAMEGIKFYLLPDFSKINSKLFIDVLGQVFFALSLGFGVMITLSSFLNKKEELIKTSVITCVINTFIAVLAGFIIFPLLFSFGVSPDAGPKLVFESLPIVFSKMHFGSFFMVVFFIFLMIAALTTSLTIYEVVIKVLQEKLNLKRHSAILITLGFIFIFGNLPSLMSTNILSHIEIFGKNIFNAFDDISATIFFILTSFLCAVFVGWVLKDEAKKELLSGSEKYKFIIECWYLYIKYIVPLVILVIFINSFIANFIK